MNPEHSHPILHQVDSETAVFNKINKINTHDK